MGTKRDCTCPRANHQHGTRGGYQSDRCRCFPCRIAASHIKATYTRGGSWHDGTASLIGTQRRLQALHAVGWSFQALAEQLGTTRQGASQLAHGKRSGVVVFAHTAQRVAALYDEAWDARLTSTAALRARLDAERNGWVPPMAWNDDEIDDPAARPHVEDGPRELAPCGTRAAYRRHRRHGEEACPPCKAAERRARRSRAA